MRHKWIHSIRFESILSSKHKHTHAPKSLDWRCLNQNLLDSLRNAISGWPASSMKRHCRWKWDNFVSLCTTPDLILFWINRFNAFCLSAWLSWTTPKFNFKLDHIEEKKHVLISIFTGKITENSSLALTEHYFSFQKYTLSSRLDTSRRATSLF